MAVIRNVKSWAILIQKLCPLINHFEGFSLMFCTRAGTKWIILLFYYLYFLCASKV